MLRNKKFLIFFLFISILGLFFVFSLYIFFLIRSLPKITKLTDYKPSLVSFVFDRNGEKVGEFFKERRILIPYQKFPKFLIEAFVSAEDARFFEHKGVNYKAVFRAFLANLRAGKKVQGGSTITQQVARSLLLSSEKTYTRKLKEAILAFRMENQLSKEDILYLYLNQIYFGHGAYGVGMASEIYFRKKPEDLTLAEISTLAGLPPAPSSFSPIYNPKKAKERQLYVLQRMVEESYIDSEKKEEVAKFQLKIYLRKQYQKKAPYYLETIRQVLVEQIGEKKVLTGGLKIQTSMDIQSQIFARENLQKGLRDLDKRQGFRGPLSNLQSEEVIEKFLEEEEKLFINQKTTFRLLPPVQFLANGFYEIMDVFEPIPQLKKGERLKGVVLSVDDEKKEVQVQLPFDKTGVIPIKNMEWARKPDPKISFKYTSLRKPSLVLKKGDIIWVEIQEMNPSPEKEITLITLSLEQEPLVEGAVIVLDQKTGDILALVGGYSFDRSQFNRVYQAARQTGSVFKPIVYVAALDKGFTPASIIIDAPIVYDEQKKLDPMQESKKNQMLEKENQKTKEITEQKQWKPGNYSQRFSGDILFRNAFIRSMNVPTVKIIENIGVEWVIDYSRRLGIFSPLNPDYTLALGSSSVTLYEMTKVFSVFGRLGLDIHPLIVHEVVALNQETLLKKLSLDLRFEKEMLVWKSFDEERRKKFFDAKAKTETEKIKKPSAKKEPSFFFQNPNQLISKQTAFLMTSLLSAAIAEPEGTGSGAKMKQQPVAGKTGTTNGYYDAWFIGYTPEIVAGVWVGFDNEQSLGKGETGARAALPIWRELMKQMLEEKEIQDFDVPEGILFTNIDNETGQLVSLQSNKIVRQAFIEGSQPQLNSQDETEEEQEFLREDLSQ